MPTEAEQDPFSVQQPQDGGGVTWEGQMAEDGRGRRDIGGQRKRQQRPEKGDQEREYKGNRREGGKGN